MKVAVYVEGITEAAFVYHFIREHYQSCWTDFRLECLNLDPKEASSTLIDYGDENASDYFLIYDSCSDNAVSSDIKARFDSHLKAGYDKIVGLRDVYSDNYKKLYPQQFDKASVSSFIDDMKSALSTVDDTGVIRLRFAIMEIEAWLLAMSEVFCRIDSRIDATWLLENADVDISKDPETEYFHPFSKLEGIYKSVSRSYSKHWDEIKEIIFKIQKEDFDALYNSGQCNSFREFSDAIFM